MTTFLTGAFMVGEENNTIIFSFQTITARNDFQMLYN